MLERHPRIDLLVNNAGRGAATFLGVDPEAVESVIDTNYLGSVWCLRAFLPGLGPGSHVVNVVSIAGLFAYGPYSAVEARPARVLPLGGSRAGAGASRCTPSTRA